MIENTAQQQRGWARRPKDRLPPELLRWQKWLQYISVIVGSLALILAVNQLISISPLSPFLISNNPSWTYLAFGTAIFSLIFIVCIRNNIYVHEARLVVRDKVEAKLDEACLFEPWLADPNQTNDYQGTNVHLVSTVNELRKLGPEGWTEFQVLRLDKALVDLWDANQLETRSVSTLAYLEEYGEDNTFRYDEKQYESWKSQIETATKKLERSDKTTYEPNSDPLRAELKGLFEEIAHYEESWAEGSVILRVRPGTL